MTEPRIQKVIVLTSSEAAALGETEYHWTGTVQDLIAYAEQQQANWEEAPFSPAIRQRHTDALERLIYRLRHKPVKF